MGLATYTYNRSTSGGEIITHLINATDGEGLHFDGAAGTYVDCGDTTILDGAPKMSVEVISATSSTAVGRILGKDSGASCFKLQANADGTITFRVNNGSDGTATTSGTYNDGNPKHIVGTWDNATLSIYVNGNLDGTATLAGGSIPATTDKLALGAELDSGTTNADNFDGILYRARLWNKSLSQAEVTASYENATVSFADQYGPGAWPLAFSFTAGGVTSANLSSITGTGFTVDVIGGYIRKVLVSSAGFSKNFRVRMAGTQQAAQTITLSAWDGTSLGLDAITDDTFDTTFEFKNLAINGFRITVNGATGDVTCPTFKVYQTGVVADYDLAFANPSPSPNGQSLMVRDRASAADGTSSATGVVQITPIEQLNTKALRIGTTAATPADGELLVSGGIVSSAMPTSDPTVAGQLWNDSGTVKISSG